MDQKLRSMIGHTTEERFKHMVSSKLSNNYPIKVEYVTNAHTIFGHDLGSVKGKKVRHKLDRVEMDLTKIPIDFYELHKFLNLTAYVMFVKSIAFLTTLSRNIKFITVKHIPSCAAAQLGSYLTKVVKM